MLLTAQQLNDVFKPVTELTKSIANSALVQPVKNVAGQLPSQNSMMARGLGGSPVAQALANLNFPLQETKEAVEESSNQAQQVESESSSIISGELDVIKDLLSHIAIDTEGLVNLNAELLSTWVDQATMERIMHEEQMAQSAADRLRQIEESRERARESGKTSDDEPGKAEKVPDKSGGLFSQIGGMFSKIPGFGMVSSLFSGGVGGITKIFGKLFIPFTIVLGILSFVEGFMKGKEEGGIGEGVIQGLEMLIENILDVPLNMLKDLLAWALDTLGFDEASEQVAKFDFDISSIVRPIIDFFTGLFDTLMDIPNQISDFVKNQIADVPFIGGAISSIGSFFGGDDEELAKATPASAAAEIKRNKEGFRMSPEEMSEEEQEDAFAARRSKIRKDNNLGRYNSSTNDFFRKRDKASQDKVDAFNQAQTEKHNSPEMVAKREAMMAQENIQLAEEAIAEETDPAIKAEMLKELEGMRASMGGSDIRGAAAGRIQDAGVAKAGAGGGPTVVNAPVTNVQEGSKSSVVMPQGRDLHADPSLAQINP